MIYQTIGVRSAVIAISRVAVIIALAILTGCGFLGEDEDEDPYLGIRPPYPQVGQYRVADWGPTNRLLVWHTPKKNDGEWIWDSAGLYSMKIDGSDLIPVALNSEVGGTVFEDAAQWSPDGEWIAFAGGGYIYRVRPDGSELTRLVPYPGMVVPGLSWSPDSQWLVYNAIYMDDWSESGLWIVNVFDPDERRQLRWPENWREQCPHCVREADVRGWSMFMPQWLPDGNTIAYIPGEVHNLIALYDTMTARVDFLFGLNEGRSIHSLDFSREGDHFVFYAHSTNRDPDLPLGIVRRDAGDYRWIRNGGTNPVWSPDKRKIAFLRYDSAMNVHPCRAGMDEVWVTSVDGRKRRQVTHSNRKPLCP